MFTALVLILIAIMWWRSNAAFGRSHSFFYRRQRAAWVWSFIGAAIGSFFGVAGLGTAIAGTIPGAVVAYFAADYLMLRGSIDGGGRPQGEASSLQSAEGVIAGAQIFLRGLFLMAVAALKISFVLAFLGAIVYFYLDGKWPPLGGGDVPVPFRDKNSNVTLPAQPVQSPYEFEVNRMRQDFPQLDPISPLFDKNLSASIFNRMRFYEASGRSPEVSLRQAVLDIMTPKQSSVYSSPSHSVRQPPVQRPIQEQVPVCVYKGVMSDADYRACGVEPPVVR